MARTPTKMQGGGWMYRFVIDGQTYRGRSKTATKAEMQAEIEDRVEEHAKSFRGERIGPVYFKDAAESYGKQMDGKGQRKSIYEKKALEHFGEWKLNKIHPGHINEWVLKYWPGKVPSQNDAGKYVRAAINHMAQKGECNSMRWTATKYECPEKKIPPLEWYGQFDQACRDFGPSAAYVPYLVYFMLYTGRRISECLRLTDENVDFKRSILEIGRVKNGTYLKFNPGKKVMSLLADCQRTSRMLAMDHMIPMHPATREKLRGPRIFASTNPNVVRLKMEEVCAKAGIDHYTPHVCGRHAFATTMADAGMNANDIARIGGWKDVGIVMKRYIHSSATVDDAMRVFEGLGMADGPRRSSR